MPSKKKVAKKEVVPLEEKKVSMPFSDFMSIIQCMDALGGNLAGAVTSLEGGKVAGGKKALLKNSKEILDIAAEVLNDMMEAMEEDLGCCEDSDGECCGTCCKE